MTGPFQILDKENTDTLGHRLLDVAESTKKIVPEKWLMSIIETSLKYVRSTVDAFYDLIVTHEKNIHDDWCNWKCGKMLSNS